MTDGARPLSRKERRALEAQRQAAGDPTQALPVAPESEGVNALTRRDRRRLERLERPMEVWTAEEEMIATGQIPAMTPQVIAEQERLARERAAQADAEARAAADALGIPTPGRGGPVVPDAAVEPVVEVPDAVVEPVVPVPDAVVEPVVEVPDAVVEPVAAAPELALEAPVAAAPELALEAPVAATPAADEIPEQFRDWFPPGSLQARAFEAKPVEPLQGVSPDAVDEIRRLTHEAMAGITRATTGAVPLVEPEATPEPAHVVELEPAVEPAPLADVGYEPAGFVPELVADPEPVAQTVPGDDPSAAGDVPGLPEGVDVEALWAASAQVETLPDAGAPAELADVPFVSDFSTAVPDGTHNAEVAPAQWNTLVPASVAAQRPAVDDPPGAAQVWAQAVPAAPTIWDTHPLAQVDAAPVREIEPQTPAQDLPRPDLSALLPTPAVPETPQGLASPGAEATGAETTEAKAEALPPAAAGARHFRWAHLAVIGAIAFLLGVLAWNIARSGS